MNTLLIIIAVLAVLTLTIIITLYVIMIKARKDAYIKRNVSYYDVAYAGDVKNGVKEKKSSLSYDNTHFFDIDGRRINKTNYCAFMVSGNSMKICGIHDSDLVFVKKLFNPTILEHDLPKVLVIKRRVVKTGEAKYKLRRAWLKCAITANFDNLFKSLVKKTSFKELLNSPECEGFEKMKEDFLRVRLPEYKKQYRDCDEESSPYHEIIISTTLQTNTKEVHFSIHPVINVVGVASYSFTVNKTLEI